jgi:hypothetical protein
MEFDEVPVEVCVDIGVDGPVNPFALLDQAAQRFPDRGSVDPAELDAHLLHLAGAAVPGCGPATEEQLRQGAETGIAPTTGLILYRLDCASKWLRMPASIAMCALTASRWVIAASGRGAATRSRSVRRVPEAIGSNVTVPFSRTRGN